MLWMHLDCWEVHLTDSKLLNPRPCTPIFMTWTCGGGVDATPPRVSRLRVVELSGKRQLLLFQLLLHQLLQLHQLHQLQIASDEYPRLVVRFLVLGQYLTQL